ncbi:MAG: pyruvate formate lyase family protein, partial [Lachnospiraceae bacterium]
MKKCEFEQWDGFLGSDWKQEINVKAFIKQNVTSYEGNAEFLEGPTGRTSKLMNKLTQLLSVEQGFGGVLDIDTQEVSSLTAYQPGYLDKEEELIVGLQTNRPLKRGVNPFGGINMARKACQAYGYRLSDKIEQEFQYRTTHNDGVFRVYTDEMKKVRHAGILTGLPDAYGRGRIIGDYRRVALYGLDVLLKEKEEDKKRIGEDGFDVEEIRLSEEVFQQIQFLKKMQEMALMYGIDISKPAQTAKEAMQWTYFAYLGAIKEQNGAAMSLGRVSSFLDIYIQRDMSMGLLDEQGAQELVDHFVMKLRMARHLRTPEYNELFGGDPMWITEALGGMMVEGKTL